MATFTADGDAKSSQKKPKAVVKGKHRHVVPVIPLALMPRRPAATLASQAPITTPTATVPSTPISAKANNGSELAADIVSPLSDEEAPSAPVAPSALHTPTSITVTAANDEEEGKTASSVGTVQKVATSDKNLADGSFGQQHDKVIETAEPHVADGKEVSFESNTPSSMESPPTNTTTPLAESGASHSQAVDGSEQATSDHHLEYHGQQQEEHDKQQPGQPQNGQPQYQQQQHGQPQHIQQHNQPQHQQHGQQHIQHSQQHIQHDQQQQQHSQLQHGQPQHSQQQHYPLPEQAPLHPPDFLPPPHLMGGTVPPPYMSFHPPAPASRNAMSRPGRVAPLAHIYGGGAKGQFDAFPDSPIGPSPGPPFGGIAPPPGFMMDGPPRTAMPPPTGHVAASSNERRQIPGFPPQAHHHIAGPPPASHAFHNSQGSIHDDVGMHGPLPLPPMSTFDAPAPGLAGTSRPIPPPGYMMDGVSSPHHHHHHHMDGLNDANSMRHHVRSQFREPAFADCQLALYLASGNNYGPPPPTMFPVHSIILSRSPTLKELLLHRGPAPHPVVKLVTDDVNVRPDAFDAALHHLYGYELLNPGVLPMPSTAATAQISVMADRFNYALSYSASGNLLCWEPVTSRGLAIAAHYMDWPVLERGLEFVLGPMPFRGAMDRESQLPYNGTTAILMRSMVNFLVRHIPVGFVLDKTVADPEPYARLPNVPSGSPSPPRQQQQPPLVARGSSVSHRPGRLQDIKFGDMVPLSASSAPSRAPTIAPAVTATLSRVLLNLPFLFLQPVLEHFGMSPDWANREARHQIVVDVLMEREARRKAVVHTVVEGQFASARGVQRGLQSAQARSLDEWDVLGWDEQISSINDMGVALLMRSWTPLHVPFDGPLYP